MDLNTNSDEIKKIDTLIETVSKFKNINTKIKDDCVKKLEKEKNIFYQSENSEDKNSDINEIAEEIDFLKEINSSKKLSDDYNKFYNFNEIPNCDDILKIEHIPFEEKKYLIDMINMYQDVEPHNYDMYKDMIALRDEINFRYKNICSLKNKKTREKYKRSREITLPTYDEILNLDNITDENANYLIDKTNRIVGYISADYEEGIKKSKKIRTEIETCEYSINSESSLMSKIKNSDLPNNYKYKLCQKISFADDYDKPKVCELVSQACDIPFKKIEYDIPKNMAEFCRKFRNILDEELYGLNKVKEELITSVCCKAYTANSKYKAIALVGPPGTGKTSIARAVSKVFNIPFEQISMNTISSGSDLTGHGFTYTGSQPGRIVKSLINMKCNNGVLFLDEIDKVNNNNNDSVMHSLMNICDFSQNSEFTDNYFGELKIDLSNLLIICSLNDATKMNYILSDRIKLIQINGYNTEEKIEITKKIIFKFMKELELDCNKINIPLEIIKHIINKDNEINTMSNDCNSCGVRGIENIVKHLLERIKILAKNCDTNMSYYINNFSLPYTLTHEDCNLILLNYGTQGKGQSDLLESINNSELPIKNKQELRLKLANLNENNSDYYKAIEFIKQACKLPFKSKIYNVPNSMSELYFKFKKVLDEELYGMEKVKEELITTFCCKFKNPNAKSKVIALVGSPGTGKTTIARSIAKVFNLPFEQISMNSLESSSDLVGHNYTYVGSQSGRIVKSLVKMGCNNGVLFFDEIDKLSDKKKDIENALMNILDYSQNNEFTDNFLQNIKIDLSNLIIVCSLNDISKLDLVLADRVKFIHVDDYNLEEKVTISKKMVDKIMGELNLDKTLIKFSNGNMKYIIKLVEENEDRIGKREHGGVRSLENIIRHILERLKILIDMQSENYDTCNLAFSIKKIVLPYQIENSDIDILAKNFMAKKEEVNFGIYL